jgi:hypothetical protein
VARSGYANCNQELEPITNNIMGNSITIQKDGIAISVSVLVFRDNGVYIVYCPSLDLSGYDNTVSGATDNFSYVLKEWIKEQTANGTLEKDLTSHGW